MLKNRTVEARVALRKESVDRNPFAMIQVYHTYVALRKESVDRNTHTLYHIKVLQRSLSARRAWIEILLRQRAVNRDGKSLSARRAWIEIANTKIVAVNLHCRSPQGERG